MEIKRKIYLFECLKVVYKVDFVHAFIIFILKIFSAFVPAIRTWAVAEFINRVTANSKNLLQDTHIISIIFLMVGLIAYSWISKGMIELSAAHLEMKLNEIYKSDLVEKISRLEYRIIEEAKNRDGIGRVNSDVSTRVKSAYLEILSLAELIIKYISILAIIFLQVWWAALIILFVSVPCFYISIKSGKEEYIAETKVSAVNRINEYYNEILKNREYVDERTLFKYSGTFMKRFIQQYESARKFKTGLKIKWYIRMKIGSMATIIVSATMIAILLPLCLNGSLSIGMFIALTNSIFNIVQNMSWDLTWAIDRNVWFNEYFKDMENILNMKEDDEGLENKLILPTFEALEFKNVSFKYPETEKYVLKNLSFKIYKNKNYAFVGANGAGKSTIIKLISGLYKEYDGQILVNGKDIRKYNREFISVAFQDFARYPISIKDNIIISRKDFVSTDELEKTVQELELAQTVSKLKEGLDTVLGKSKNYSLDVSGGEWQRIALARCKISTAPVKILDEPTSAMDPIYETMIYKKFKEISKGKTIILISHRLASVQMADIIFVLEKGKIEEAGNHHDLMQRGGLYKNMYKQQAKWYTE